jgi:hypothetical protein
MTPWRLLVAALALAAIVAPRAAWPVAIAPADVPPEGAPAGAPRDPLVPLLGRMNHYIQRHEVDGVTIDPRIALHAPEAIRLSVISQLLGYEELHRVQPNPRWIRDIDERADYLVAHFDLVRGNGPFDGMLGLGLLQAHQVTGDPEHLAKGREVVEELLALPGSQRLLNGGLMLALALARHHEMTGDPRAGDAVRDVLALLPPFQNDDGSFPHWCECSKDVHYTGWMAMELVLLGRMFEDERIAPMLRRMTTFLEERVGPDGNTRYEEPCDDGPDCWRYYDSVRSGCGIDVDTRAFTNELGYTALAFDHFGSPEYPAVMSFLVSLENGGTFADKWDHWPPPDDPYYPWTAADTSVVNMSVIFWSLAATLSGREGPQPVVLSLEDRERETSGGVGAPRRTGGPLGKLARVGVAAATGRWRAVDERLLAGERPLACDASPRRSDPAPGSTPSGGLALHPATPNPATESCELRFALPRGGRVALEVFDAAGRRVRRLVGAALDPGAHVVRWNRRDDAGARCPSGLYLVRLRAGAESRSVRVLVIG